MYSEYPYSFLLKIPAQCKLCAQNTRPVLLEKNCPVLHADLELLECVQWTKSVIFHNLLQVILHFLFSLLSIIKNTFIDKEYVQNFTFEVVFYSFNMTR